MKTRNTPSTGFTLIELVTILGLLALGAAVLAPALARTQPNSRAFQCLHNARQLATAVGMYCADNADLYPPNPDDGNTTPGYNWCPGEVSLGGANEFDPQILRDPAKCLLASYLGGNADVFRCPADTRRGLADGETAALPGMAGKTIACARSVSMSQAVGTVDVNWLNTGCGSHSGKPTHTVTGPWLTGTRICQQNTWATFGRSTDFRTVDPSQIFLLTDEDSYSINDGGLAFSAGTPLWIDYPATWHDHGATLSFCDGHAEVHKWVGNTLILTTGAFSRSVTGTGPDYADWAWMRSHTSQLLH